MEISKLLEELINIAQKPKTDFALSMNMTPSGLSKILAGRNRPLLNEKKTFSTQAAGYFAEAIYSPICYLKFAAIFPVIYDFESRNELEAFLVSAIEYSLDKELTAETNDNADYSNKGLNFLGKRMVLNLLCIIVSDYFVSNPDIPLEFYSTLQFCNPLYADIFRRIRVPGLKPQKTISFHHFLDEARLEASRDKGNLDFFSNILKMQEYADLNLWDLSGSTEQSFLLLKGQFLLIFSIQLDGTFLMSLIKNKHYLKIFLNSLLKQGAKKSATAEAKRSLFWRPTRRLSPG